MASRSNPTPFMKFAATGVGIALCGGDTWLNAEHIARSEGWASSLVVVVILATIGAAIALPIAERCAKTKQPVKAGLLMLFFALMMLFSFSASVGRTGGKRDAETAAARADNTRVVLAREAYAAAQKAQEAECVKRGPKCRAAEEAVTEARKALSAKPAERVEDSGAERIAAIFPSLTAADVTLYQPLILPFSLQIGGFVMLAYGLSPRREPKPEPKRQKRKRRKKAAAKPAKTNADRQREWRERQRSKLTIVK
ncbi:MAG: hypothetical protein WBX25_35700 [Rhodomicrobium sp.]